MPGCPACGEIRVFLVYVVVSFLDIMTRAWRTGRTGSGVTEPYGTVSAADFIGAYFWKFFFYNFWAKVEHYRIFVIVNLWSVQFYVFWRFRMLLLKLGLY